MAASSAAYKPPTEDPLGGSRRRIFGEFFCTGSIQHRRKPVCRVNEQLAQDLPRLFSGPDEKAEPQDVRNSAGKKRAGRNFEAHN